MFLRSPWTPHHILLCGFHSAPQFKSVLQFKPILNAPSFPTSLPSLQLSLDRDLYQIRKFFLPSNTELFPLLYLKLQILRYLGSTSWLYQQHIFFLTRTFPSLIGILVPLLRWWFFFYLFTRRSVRPIKHDPWESSNFPDKTVIKTFGERERELKKAL